MIRATDDMTGWARHGAVNDHACCGGPRARLGVPAKYACAALEAGVRTCNTDGGVRRPAGMASGPASDAATKHRLQWSQALVGVWPAGPCSAAEAGPPWQMIENGSTEAPAGCIDAPNRIACMAMAKHATQLTLLRILPFIVVFKP